MSKKTVAEWISIILCLLPSPFFIMVLLTLSGQMRDTWHISLALAITIYAIIGLIALFTTSWLLGKLVYFIIR